VSSRAVVGSRDGRELPVWSSVCCSSPPFFDISYGWSSSVPTLKGKPLHSISSRREGVSARQSYHRHWRAIEFRGTSLCGAPLAVDDIVPVYYLASDPKFGEIAAFRRFWLGVAVSSTCIMLLLWLGIWILRFGRGSRP